MVQILPQDQFQRYPSTFRKSSNRQRPAPARLTLSGGWQSQIGEGDHGVLQSPDPFEDGLKGATEILGWSDAVLPWDLGGFLIF
jgi:hypothetical protein